jgi:Helicase conserved C-terminal domain
MPRQKETPAIPNVHEALDVLTIDQLKPLVALLPTKERPTRKGELVALVEHYLSGARLRELWEQLDEKQKLAVAETLYDEKGVFNAHRFRAKYGALPVFGTKKDKGGYGEIPSLLRLFIYRAYRYSDGASVVPEDLQQRLLSIVPKPSGPVLKATDELPEHFELVEKEYAWQEGDQGITVVMGKKVFQMPRQQPKTKTITHQIPLTRRDTERAAQQDLQTVLRLVDKGRIAVSEKTFHASAAAVDEIASLLRDGDFYELTPKQNKWDQAIGPIKAFAWPLLVQAVKLAELHGKKLVLTKAGRNALGAPAAETLRLSWQRWLKTKLLDEFNRVDEIKGQHGKGKRSMTAVEGRRVAINEALKQCPVGSWVKVDDVFRFMVAAGFEFEVTREPWDLYISDPQYGSLGYEGFHDWGILQGRYALCLLFEYAATLGLIDVAYVDPAGVRCDFRNLWGTDDLDFLSRYDGLIYVRLNPLGAYCLGLAEEYKPSEVQARASLTVLPSLHINVTGEALSPDEALLLGTYAEQESDTVWRLDREKALAAVESGNQIAELREFLQARDEQPLPETVESFITTTERRARALVNKGTALLIEGADAEIADLVANHERMKKLCLRAGERHLVVPVEAEEQFRKALRSLGYGMPRV